MVISILIASLGVTLIASMIAAPFIELRRTKTIRAFIFVAYFLTAAGTFGFFATAFASSSGMDFLLRTFKWPAGYVTGVKRSADGSYVVPLRSSGRIQVYDEHWNFLRGWQVDASGGTFEIDVKESVVQAYFSRGREQATFDFQGRLISQIELPDEYANEFFSNTGSSHLVPTSPLLWPFTHPFLSLGLAMLGGTAIGLDDMVKQKKDAKSD